MKKSFFEQVDVPIRTATDNSSHGIWTEKYRPQKLDDYIGNSDLKKKIKSWLDSNDIAHLLFYGSAGTGKTTLAKLIVRNIECDYLYVNASDENSVDNVRTKIKGFAASVGFKDLKVVILDECDYITPNAQAALRNLMETYSQHTRFILTCNYHEKIIDPIISRCQSYAITPPNKKEVALYLTGILTKEKVKFDPQTIAFLVNAYYPDIRQVINSAQQSSVGGELVVDQKSIIESDSKLKLVDILKTVSDKKACFTQVRQMIADAKVKHYEEYYQYLYSTIDDWAAGHVANCILILAESQYQDSFVVDKEIGFSACMIKIIQEIKK